jgi:hypothetical protein
MSTASMVEIQTLLRTLPNRSDDGSNRVKARAIARSLTHVDGADTTLLTTDGAGLSASVYDIDMAVGSVTVGGLQETLAAMDDVDLLTAGEFTSIDLNGDQAIALAADGTDVEVAIFACIVNSLVVRRAVFGAVAATGAAVPPTPAQCAAAMALAAEANYLPSELGVIIARILYDRVATATLAATHRAAASLDSLKDERLNGLLA